MYASRFWEKKCFFFYFFLLLKKVNIKRSRDLNRNLASLRTILHWLFNQSFNETNTPAFLQTSHITRHQVHQTHFPAFHYVSVKLYGFVDQYILEINQYIQRTHRELVKNPGVVQGHEIIAIVGSIPIALTLQKEPYIIFKWKIHKHNALTNKQSKHRSLHMPRIYHKYS